MSKNEGASNVSLACSGWDEKRPCSRPPSTSIRSGIGSRALGLDFGDGGSRVSVLVGLLSGLGRTCAPGVDAKWERLPCPRLKPLFSSVCRLKASKSGFAPSGKCCGESAPPKERMDEVGGLQLSFGPTPESLGSLAGSTIRPK